MGLTCKFDNELILGDVLCSATMRDTFLGVFLYFWFRQSKDGRDYDFLEIVAGERYMLQWSLQLAIKRI
jgi:hypothetical protein